MISWLSLKQQQTRILNTLLNHDSFIAKMRVKDKSSSKGQTWTSYISAAW